MIARNEVTDLHNQDLIRLTSDAITGLEVTGKLYRSDGGGLQLASWLTVRRADGELAGLWEGWSLEVIARAPRPLYVNHPRTEPLAGDVVRDAEDDISPRTWVKNVDGLSHEWLAVPGHHYVPRDKMPNRLRLLVDAYDQAKTVTDALVEQVTR